MDAQRDLDYKVLSQAYTGKRCDDCWCTDNGGPLRTRSGELPAGWRTSPAVGWGWGCAGLGTRSRVAAHKWIALCQEMGQKRYPRRAGGHLPPPHPKSVQLRVRAPRHHLRGAHPSRRRRARIPRYRARLTARRTLYVHYLLLCQRARRQARQDARTSSACSAA